jgi:hypothetical protein
MCSIQSIIVFLFKVLLFSFHLLTQLGYRLQLAPVVILVLDGHNKEFRDGSSRCDIDEIFVGSTLTKSCF